MAVAGVDVILTTKMVGGWLVCKQTHVGSIPQKMLLVAQRRKYFGTFVWHICLPFSNLATF